MILIDGTGAPPVGPVDIVVEKNRISQIQVVGYPGMPISENRRPRAGPDDKVYELAGHYLMPGFIDSLGYIGGSGQGTPAEYVFKLWMAHGITTIRDPSAGNGLDWVLDQKKRSAPNEITAPRMLAYTSFGYGAKAPITTAAQAKAWVNENAKKGADGIKFFGAIRIDENNEPIRVGGVKHTVKDGIVYDAKKLLEDLKAMVDKHKAEEGFTITQPCLDW